ncbi:MAG: sporulation protein [Deltaproteobacteria bacterium]|nr:sporulation protein [Nannocystaceae bacterium]
MGFSEKMRDSLGAEGAKLEITVREGKAAVGEPIALQVAIVGGSKPAIVEALVVRVVESARHWVDRDGSEVSEQDAQARDDRSGLVAGWTRTTLGEVRVAVDVTVEPGARHDVDVELGLTVPAGCRSSSASCNHAVHVQADIKGQIDPTAQARLEVA